MIFNDIHIIPSIENATLTPQLLRRAAVVSTAHPHRQVPFASTAKLWPLHPALLWWTFAIKSSCGIMVWTVGATYLGWWNVWMSFSNPCNDTPNLKMMISKSGIAMSVVNSWQLVQTRSLPWPQTWGTQLRIGQRDSGHLQPFALSM